MSKSKILLIYITLGITSCLFIGLYWAPFIAESIRNVFMSIGASLIGAVVLGLLIEISLNRQKIRNKKEILADSINAANATLQELGRVYEEFKADNDIGISFNDENEFTKESMKKYLSLTERRNAQDNLLAKKLKESIFDDIVNKTFIVDCCKVAVFQFDIVLKSQNELLVSGILAKDEIRSFSTARARMNYFINQTENNDFYILLSNALNFKDSLEKIVGIEKRKQ